MNSRLFVLTLAMLALSMPAVVAQGKDMDADPDDWCLGQPSVTRVDDSSATLTCGHCQGLSNEACNDSGDCPGGVPCIGGGSSYEEVVWWDARTDGAINDLGTFAMAQDNSNLYIIAELWVDPDPVALPFGQLVIDFEPGGGNVLWDPGSPLTGTPPNQITAPGVCSGSTDRACTKDADCHFCGDSYEPPACCEIGTCPPTDLCRVRACGSGCDVGDVCDQSQTCTGLNPGVPTNNIGLNASPAVAGDYNVLFDFSVWLGSGGAQPSADLRRWNGATWAPIPSNCSITGAVCASNADCPAVGGSPQVCATRFFPTVDPGASGGSGGPPGAVELAIPWSAFGCTGCPGGCVCPDFGPGQDFTYSLIISRGEFVGDFVPRGEIEDVASEAVGGTTTTSTDDCPGTGIGNTSCEIADTSTDAFVPQLGAAVAGGRVGNLTVAKGAGMDVTLSWDPSCSNLDTDYEVYEGTLASLGGGSYDHGLVVCTTGGATMETFASSAGAYYLVVPTDTSIEGSYGKDSNAAERPVGAPQCRAQGPGGC